MTTSVGEKTTLDLAITNQPDGLFYIPIEDLVALQTSLFNSNLAGSVYSAHQQIGLLHNEAISRAGISQREVEQLVAARLMSYLTSAPLPIVQDASIPNMTSYELMNSINRCIREIAEFATFLTFRGTSKSTTVWTPSQNRGALIVAKDALPPQDLESELDNLGFRHRRWRTQLENVFYEERTRSAQVTSEGFVVHDNPMEVFCGYVFDSDTVQA